MAGTKAREHEFLRWPKYKAAYLNAFEKMLRERKLRERKTEWQNANDVFNWWMDYDIMPGQISFDDYEEDDDATFPNGF